MGEMRVVESLEITDLFIDAEFTLSWDPCFAIIRWRSGSSHMCVSTRPSPPYRDWIPDRAPPVIFDQLVYESRMHHRCLLGFDGSMSVSTQTDSDINFEYVNPEASSGSRDSAVGTQVSPSSGVVVATKARPPTRAEYRAARIQNEQFRARPPSSGSSAFFDPSVIHRAHVSESTRDLFLSASYSSDSRFRRPGTQGTARPAFRSQYAIEGPVQIPARPIESRPLPPQIPPQDRHREGGAFFARPEGIRFLYTEPALRMRNNPEVSIPPSISLPQEFIRGDPETDPDA